MSFPDVSDALWGLTDEVVFKKVVKSVANGQVTENVGDGGAYGGGGFGIGPFGTSDSGQEGIFDGALQPMPPQRVAMKAEGERQWKYWLLWTDFTLELDEVIQDGDGRLFRVMGLGDWTAGGYREYELVQDFDGVPPS